jgi:hypothetical protein
MAGKIARKKAQKKLGSRHVITSVRRRRRRRRRRGRKKLEPDISAERCESEEEIQFGFDGKKKLLYEIWTRT